MDTRDQFLKRAADCEQMARSASDTMSRLSWNRMAERWRLCAANAARERRPATHREAPKKRYRRNLAAGWAPIEDAPRLHLTASRTTSCLYRDTPTGTKPQKSRVRQRSVDYSATDGGLGFARVGQMSDVASSKTPAVSDECGRGSHCWSFSKIVGRWRPPEN